MTSIEETGKNIEEATQRALEQLGVTEDEVDVEILEEGAKGFLGIGQSPAQVRVTLRKRPAAPKRDKPAPKPKPILTRAPKAKEKAEPVSEAPPEEAAPAETAEPAGGVSEDVLQQAAEISRELLQRILDGIGEGAKAAIRSASDGQVILDIVGGDTAILIGKHGHTIDALQYLVGVMTSRRLGERVRVIVDSEGYRARREEALRSHALSLARKVRETGEEAVLDPLQPNERRIVHLALVDDPSVYTYSEGEEPTRRVVISPKDKAKIT